MLPESPLTTIEARLRYLLPAEMYASMWGNPSVEIMMDVHNSGSGVCGVYSKEVAESKSVKVNQFSSLKGFPLKSSIEPE